MTKQLQTRFMKWVAVCREPFTYMDVERALGIPREFAVKLVLAAIADRVVEHDDQISYRRTAQRAS